MAIGTAAAILGSAVIGGAVASKGASKAARAQQQAADQAAQLQRETFERQVELQEPFRQAGITSQNEMLRLLGLGGDAASAGYGSLGRPFSAADMQTDPGYAFRLAEGEKALERMQAARGQYLGGGAIRAGARYGQEMGSQEYMNAFNRAQALLGNRLGVLGSLYGAGQAATQQVGQQAGQMGTNVGNLLMQGGQARASGYLGQANALSNALGQAAMGYGLSRGGYFGPTGVSSPASNNLMAFNYQGPQYGNVG
jgi:hypothetical protein